MDIGFTTRSYRGKVLALGTFEWYQEDEVFTCAPRHVDLAISILRVEDASAGWLASCYHS